MVSGDQAEDSIVTMADGGHGGGKEGARVMDGGEQSAHGHDDGRFTMKDVLWHGGSVWDSWFSCASKQVRTSSPCSLTMEGIPHHC